MKAICALMLILGVVYAKKELQAKDCGGGDAIVKLTSVKDIGQPKGELGAASVLEVAFSALKDTHALDPFDTNLAFTMKKKGLLDVYYPIPNAVIDIVAKIYVQHSKVKYLGKGVFRARCLFEDLYGTCFPPKGSHVEKIVLKGLLEKLKGRIGIIERWLGSGWYKVEVRANNPRTKKEDFCLQTTFDIRM